MTEGILIVIVLVRLKLARLGFQSLVVRRVGGEDHVAVRPTGAKATDKPSNGFAKREKVDDG